ncbi:hypothetical protein GCM10022225_49820 [Plantactinospora mayteni]|uniref:HTH cro/C1-type domain-containing protein n=1 Tax=Plantactinospora mayteni TaxID=566021 RepID=A0ABQ4EXV0_9ACTN|nr:helix-turn-helix domain-containing protein [Plantactinospora mayteni]GIG99480.1 hypothetical protein Pma05_60530 [Plantactinospora mayteni]
MRTGMPDDTDPTTTTASLGALMRAWRERALLTQEELAERAGLNARTIRRLEGDELRRPRSTSLRLLAEALALNPAEQALLIGSARGAGAGAGRVATGPAGTGQAEGGGPAPTADDTRGGRPGTAAPTIAALPVAVPRQLPADLAAFTGRTAECARLDAVLAGAGEHPTAVPVILIAGTAGVGKTILAVHWAHHVRDRFPDGQLYVNLRGFEPSGSALSPAEAVRGFLDAFDVPPHRVPSTVDAQVGLYRSLLADRRVLVVLDNARDAEQVRPLLPGSPGSLVVVTSRNQLTSLVAAAGSHPMLLGMLSEPEARQLLARRLGPDRAAAEPAAIDEIVARCAGLPLALSIVAARAATNPGFPLETLAAELRDTLGGLDTFDAGDPVTDVRAVFSWSYRTLGAAAARLFRLLGTHPGPEIGVSAAASLAGLPVPRVRPLLAELTRAHLLAEHVPGRYTFHDLLRAYAAELNGLVDPEPERQEARYRMLDHYLHSADIAALLLRPGLQPVGLAPPRPGTVVDEFADSSAATVWLGTEYPVLLAAIGLAAGSGFDTHAWQLARTLDDFLDRRGRWGDVAAAQRTALAAATRSASPTGQAYAHRGLSRAYFGLGRYDDSHLHLRLALSRYVETGDRIGQAETTRNVCRVLERQGQYRPALDYALRALELYPPDGPPTARARLHNDVGWLHALLGDYQQTLVHCRRALAVHQQAGDPDGEPNTWDSLGYAHHHLGNHDEAITCYQRALRLFAESADRVNEAETLVRLGDTQRVVGEVDAARSCWVRALEILAEFGHPGAASVRDKLARLSPDPVPSPLSPDPVPSSLNPESAPSSLSPEPVPSTAS